MPRFRYWLYKICKMKLFKDEFSRRNFTFNIDCADESKNVFVQSKIEFISPSAILIFRMTATLYFLFGLLLSVTNHEGDHPWTVYMTSLNYLLVVIYFVYGLTVSSYAVFFRRSYYRNVRGGTLTRKCNVIQNSKKDVVMTIMPNVYDVSPTTCSKFGSKRERKVDLVQNRYSIDALVFGIEDGNKTLSLPYTNARHNNHHGVNEKKANTRHYNHKSENEQINSRHHSHQSVSEQIYRHARLHNNQLPKITWETVATEGHSSELGMFFKTYWLCSCVAFNMTALTVLVYWTMMFPQQKTTGMTQFKWFLRIDRHGIVFIFMIIDHMLSGIPTRILHFIYPSLFFMLYGFVSAIYTIVTRDYVYKMLNFHESVLKSVLFIAGASFVAIPLVQVVIYWTVYRLRERLFRSF